MIFQFYHLLPELTTLENVLAPLMIAEGAWSYFRHRSRHVERARQLLDMVGLSHRLKHKPRELSGAKCSGPPSPGRLMAEPEVLLADEPTGNLDTGTGEEILRILRTLNDQRESHYSHGDARPRHRRRRPTARFGWLEGRVV